MLNRSQVIACTAALAACSGAQDASLAQNSAFTATEIARFDEPWSMSFLPDGRLLVAQKGGALKLYAPNGGKTGDVRGIPAVEYGGQGGFGDVVLHPKFTDNGLVYLSYAESGDRGTAGAAVARAKLVLAGDGGELTELAVIWRQVPKVDGGGHYGHRIAFGPDGHLWISSGERQKFDPAQDMRANLGKIVRLNDDGSVPSDNPFRGSPRRDRADLVARSSQSTRPRFRRKGRLWNVEMGPRGGDELNLVRARRELRLSDRLQRQPLRRSKHSGSSDASRFQRSRGILESRDLAFELDVL